ncbi:MAG: PEP-CTERM sorting domain-containing protein [Hydrococcus sp. Prado102]|nr:PEP-CTERM sorting domain-containing protein [Hydrococcus sp. Prado102]
MTNILSNLLVATAFSALSLISIISKPTHAATVFWDLKFFDAATGNSLGTGELSYDDSEPFEGTFPSSFPDNFPPNPDITIRTSDNWYALESFSATIPLESGFETTENATWNLSDGRWTLNFAGEEQEIFSTAALFAWQPPQTDTLPGSIGRPRSVDTDYRSMFSYSKYEQWSIGDQACCNGSFLNINGNNKSFFILVRELFTQEGRWIATKRGGGTDNEQIPEPSIVFGLAIAAGLAVSLRKNIFS